MENEEQYRDATARSLTVKSEVSSSVFDDKVKPMGFVTITKGKIVIDLDYIPSMISEVATRNFLVGSIGVAIGACYDAHSEAFNKN